ncbi:MAG: hypothetical protein HQ521_01340 [Bacteroidetes bacterium]|nr:hypothetical protein [Bacteroidota bacterium]
MAASIKINKFDTCVAINSVVYFLIAYYFVVFAFNLFSMIIASFLGFDVELFYYGFTHSGKAWTTGDLILVFFVGNAFTLLTAVLFELLYRKQRKYVRSIKILFLWIYLVSIMWFFGNLIVGAFFNFGIGTALRAFHVPFFLRGLLAMVSIFFLMFFGYRSQKHIRVSANLYFKKLGHRDVGRYFLTQIVIPIVIGIIIIVILKIPHVSQYNYYDLYLLFCFAFFVLGLFYNFKKITSLTFKDHSTKVSGNMRKSCNVAYLPVIIMIFFLAIIRLGLVNGLAF